MVKYVLLLIALAGATVADPILYASSTNTWSLQPELSTVFHVEGSGPREPTSGGYEDSFYFLLDVPTVTLPAGAVVQSDRLLVSYNLAITNTSQNIETVPLDPTLPYTPFIFSLERHWAATCFYGDLGAPGPHLCAYGLSDWSVLSPPCPERLDGQFDVVLISDTGGTGAYGGVNAISDLGITTDYALSVSATREVQYSLPVPEPGSAVAMGLSLLCLGVLCKRRTLQ
jgi:hypothetical protein